MLKIIVSLWLIDNVNGFAVFIDNDTYYKLKKSVYNKEYIFFNPKMYFVLFKCFQWALISFKTTLLEILYLQNKIIIKILCVI